MNKIILTCGHEVADFDDVYEVMVKATDRRNEKAIAFMVVCAKCVNEYRENEELLEHENEADEWLAKEEW